MVEYGELSQTALISYCGLNLKKHKHILDSMENKGLIERVEESQGNKKITRYKVTPKGLTFCRMILEPYEELFPRRGYSRKKDINNNLNYKREDDSSNNNDDWNTINGMLLIVVTICNRLTMLTKYYINRV